MRILKVLAFILLTAAPGLAESAKPLRVVATLSTFADLAREVGGERVDATSIASPRFNPHFIEPRPSDVLKLKRADLFLHSGLDLEPWRAALVDAAARPEIRPGGRRELPLSTGITLLEVPSGQVSRAEGDIHVLGNPHYWMSPENARIIASNIATKLSELEPESAELFQGNLKRFATELESRGAAWRTLMAPHRGKTVAAYHNQWIYFTEFFGLKGGIFLEPKPGIPPSPGHLIAVVENMKQQDVRAIVQSSYDPADAARTVAERTGANVAVVASNVSEIPEAKTYLDMIDHDVRSLAGKL